MVVPAHPFIGRASHSGGSRESLPSGAAHKPDAQIGAKPGDNGEEGGKGREGEGWHGWRQWEGNMFVKVMSGRGRGMWVGSIRGDEGRGREWEVRGQKVATRAHKERILSEGGSGIVGKRCQCSLARVRSEVLSIPSCPFATLDICLPACLLSGVAVW